MPYNSGMLEINYPSKKFSQKKIGLWDTLKAKIGHKPLLEWVALLGLMMTLNKQFLGVILKYNA
jgi:hypothetical protein